MILSLQCYRRPQYLKAVLEALRACDGIGEQRLLVDVEPGDEEVRSLVEEINFCDHIDILWHEHLYGPNRSTYTALTRAFEQDDYVVHIEDDHVLSPDALTWFANFEHGEWDQSIFNIASYNLYGYDLPYTWARRAPIASGGAWATWSSRLKDLKFRADRAWDQQLVWYARGGTEVYPLLSRCQNIGREQGTFVPPEYHDWYQHANLVADCPPGVYTELVSAKPGESREA